MNSLSLDLGFFFVWDRCNLIFWHRVIQQNDSIWLKMIEGCHKLSIRLPKGVLGINVNHVKLFLCREFGKKTIRCLSKNPRIAGQNTSVESWVDIDPPPFTCNYILKSCPSKNTNLKVVSSRRQNL